MTVTAMEPGVDPRKYPAYLLAPDAAAVERCRGAIGSDRELVPPESAKEALRRRSGKFAIVVIEHSDDHNAAMITARLADVPDRECLHLLVADPDGRQGAFVAVDAGAEDYVADDLGGEEFAFRVRAADGALSRIEDGTGLEREVDEAEPLDAAELAPSREPRLLLAAAARERGRTSRQAAQPRPVLLHPRKETPAHIARRGGQNEDAHRSGGGESGRAADRAARETPSEFIGPRPRRIRSRADCRPPSPRRCAVPRGARVGLP